MPRARAWTRPQKALIVVSIVMTLASFGALIYAYERYYRGPGDEVFFGTWALEPWMEGKDFVMLKANHDAIAFGDYMGVENDYTMRGRWYGGGKQLIIRFSDDRVDADGKPVLVVMHIDEITQAVIRGRWNGAETMLRRSARNPPQASDQATERIRQLPDR